VLPDDVHCRGTEAESSDSGGLAGLWAVEVSRAGVMTIAGDTAAGQSRGDVLEHPQGEDCTSGGGRLSPNIDARSVAQ